MFEGTGTSKQASTNTVENYDHGRIFGFSTFDGRLFFSLSFFFCTFALLLGGPFFSFSFLLFFSPIICLLGYLFSSIRLRYNTP